MKNKKYQIRHGNNIPRALAGVCLLFWLLSLCCMGLIFYLSDQPAKASAAMSSNVLNRLQTVLGGSLTEFIVRKAAHFLEYTLLAFLISWAIRLTWQKGNAPLWGLLFTSAYAATDEVHQLFVDGRACQLRDWAIDTAGAAAGIAVFAMTLLLLHRIAQKQKVKEVTK